MRLIWTRDRIAEEATNYSTRNAFRRERGSAYCAAHRKGWLDDVCSHMAADPRQGEKSRSLYAIRRGRTIYIGLTLNVDRRIASHRRNGTRSVRDLLAGPHRVYVLARNLSPTDAAKLERKAIVHFKRAGLAVINSTSGGTLGGTSSKWGKASLSKEARKYSSRSEFQHAAQGAYHAARSLGLIDEICSHMPRRKSWTVERIMSAALLFNTRGEFQIGASSAYQRAYRNGILDQVCAHMKAPRRTWRTPWTPQEIEDMARSHRNASEFLSAASGAYSAARDMGMLGTLVYGIGG